MTKPRLLTKKECDTMKSVVIAKYLRSPFTFASKGAMAKVRPDTMAAQVVKALVDKSAVDPGEIEDLILGCAFPEAEQGMNMARLVVLDAGLPISVAGATINRFCGSSMYAIHMAAGAIQMEAGEAFICAGVESMSRVPIGGYNPMPSPLLYEKMPEAYISMGDTAENVARQYQLTREEQEAFAVSSQQKASAARSEGRLREEIVSIETGGETVEEDGCIRSGTTQEDLAGLRPAFDETGTVTAGTSSPLTDGAAATLVCTEEFAARNNLEPLARIRSIAVAGCAPGLWVSARFRRPGKRLNERACLSMTSMSLN
jgi:acetyl-CoA acyltransferase